MKRARDLFPRIVDRDNLRQATHLALRGKRSRPDAREFVGNLEAELRRLRQDLCDETLPVGECRQFEIRDPKRRLITAPSFRERVLHHAIMLVCEPVFERSLIDDTYACRRGRGRIACLHRAVEFSRRFPAVLQLDIRKYFDSVSHEAALAILERRIKDGRVVRLLGRIIRSHETAPGRGLPIGSLTSQHLANLYLSPFDRFVKERLRRRGFVRYMDDSVIWGDPAELSLVGDACQGFLSAELKLACKPPKLRTVRAGWGFLGCRVFPGWLTLNRRSRRRYAARLRELTRRLELQQIDEQEFQQCAESLTAFTRAGGVKSWRTRRRVLESLEVTARARTA